MKSMDLETIHILVDLELLELEVFIATKIRSITVFCNSEAGRVVPNTSFFL